jgi:hypothetical protein
MRAKTPVAFPRHVPHLRADLLLLVLQLLALRPEVCNRVLAEIGAASQGSVDEAGGELFDMVLSRFNERGRFSTSTGVIGSSPPS